MQQLTVRSSSCGKLHSATSTDVDPMTSVSWLDVNEAIIFLFPAIFGVKLSVNVTISLAITSLKKESLR